MMGFNSGMPEQGIHHLLWPDDIAERMAPFLLGMIDSLLADDVDYLIEGEALLPRTVAGLIAQRGQDQGGVPRLRQDRDGDKSRCNQTA